MDGDDWVSSDMNEKLLHAARRNDADVAGGYMQSIREHVFDMTKIKDEYKMTLESNLATGNLDFSQIERAMIMEENKFLKRFLKSRYL